MATETGGTAPFIPDTNLLERLFLEERRRTKIIPHAFGERPVLKLMYAAVIRAADRWRGLTVGELEQRQLRARSSTELTPSAHGPPCVTSRARPRRSYPARLGLDPLIVAKSGNETRQPGDVATRVCEAMHESASARIGDEPHHDRN